MATFAQARLLRQCREPATLLPVKLAAATVFTDGADRPKRLPSQKTPTLKGAVDAGHVEIELPSGVSVRVYGAVAPTALEAVLTVLRSR